MKTELWDRLSKSAQQALTTQAEKLVEGHSGVMELHCHKGGVRLLRVGRDYKPGEMEYHLGDDN